MAEGDKLEQQRRQEILDAAEVVFSQRGLANARMDDIVSQSGLSKGTLYWYYGSKNEIIHSLLDRIFTSELEQAEALLVAEGTAAERIEIFLRLIVQEVQRIEHLMPLAYEFFSLATRSDEARARLQSYYQRYIELLADLVEQGIDDGEFQSIDPKAAALAVGALFEGVTLYWFLDPERVDWGQMEPLGISVLLDGLRRRGE